MKAAEVMVSAAISVRPNARVEEVASILLASRISAVPDEQGASPEARMPHGICDRNAIRAWIREGAKNN
jgi:hypothetical protein